MLCARFSATMPIRQVSLVEPDRLRYDFTHFSAVTADELVKISRLVSELVLDGISVETKEMPIAEAKKLGAIALFGEKYGDVVRVVNMGGKSVELCGGTHVDNTAKVGPFRITSESSVASGVRRIEAVTGEAFLNLVDEMNMRLVKAAELLKTTPMELINKAQSSMNEIRELHQTIERMKDKLFAGDVDSLMFSAKDVNGLKVVTASRENTDANDLRKLGDFLRDKNPNTVAALGAVNGEKVTLLAVCGKKRRRTRHQGGRYHQEYCAHRRRQGRRQAGFRHGRRHERPQARRRAGGCRRLRRGQCQGLRRKHHV